MQDLSAQNKKKAPDQKGQRLFSEINSSTAAAAGVAGATATGITAGAAGAAATTATADGYRRRDGETGPGAGIDEINLDLLALNQKGFVYQELNAFLIKNVVVVFWLIQSQSQRGSGSAALHDGYADRRINTVLRHVVFQVLDRKISRCKHKKKPPHTKLFGRKIARNDQAT